MRDRLNEAIAALNKDRDVLIAIDGKCASGKTTLAERLTLKYKANLFHMDDFFLRPFQRSEERLKVPGENIDHERFLKEVLKPLKDKKDIIYKAYDCHTQSFKESIIIKYRPINIIEGSYCLHPSLFDHYDLKVYIDIDKEEQLKRIKIRNKDDFQIFTNKWIPLEERYFKYYDIQKKCDIVLDQSDLKELSF